MASLGRRPGAAPLTTADIPNDSITGAKIVDDAIDSEHYAAGSVDAAHVAADVATQAELDTVSTVASAALPKAGGTMTGNIVLGDDTSIGIADDAERIEFDGDGDISLLGCLVGIGETAPDAVMEIKNSTQNQYCLHLSSSENLHTGYSDGLCISSVSGQASNALYIESGIASGGAPESGDVRMVVTGGGKVGIGTATPLYPLHLYHNDTSVDGSLTIEQDSTGDASTRYMLSGVISWAVGIDNSDSDKFKIGPNAELATSNSLTIDPSNGYVGIGTTAPSNHLTVQSATGSAWIATRRGTTGSSSGIIFKDSGAEADGTWAVYMTGGEEFYISDWTASPDAVRLSIATNGNFSGSGSSDISDERLKENIEPITDALDTIKKLTGRTYTWKSEMYMGDDTRYGLVAQEVEPIVPDLVNNSSGIRKIKKSDGSITMDDIGDDVEYSKSIHMSGVIPILIEAVKELSAKNDALEARVLALENA